MYAIIETGGKQYAVTPGQRIRIEKIDGEVGGEVELERVLLVGDDENVDVGTPVVSGAKVTGKILSHGKAKKVIVFKMQKRKNYRRKQGHRQIFTEVEVTDIQRSA